MTAMGATPAESQSGLDRLKRAESSHFSRHGNLKTITIVKMHEADPLLVVEPDVGDRPSASGARSGYQGGGR